MARTPARSGKPWTKPETRQLRELAAKNTPTRVIALKLQRTPPGIQGKASEEGISLKPTNQAPYGTKKK